MKFIIYVEGGIVQAVLGDAPAAGLEFKVVDFDKHGDPKFSVSELEYQHAPNTIQERFDWGDADWEANDDQG